MNSLEEARRSRINKFYKVEDILKDLYGYEPFTDSILCPMHDDNRKSAKIFHDPDGDRIYCFSEGKQFTISDLLLAKGEELSKWDPGAVAELELSVSEEVVRDLSELDKFKTGEITIEDFFRILIESK